MKKSFLLSIGILFILGGCTSVKQPKHISTTNLSILDNKLSIEEKQMFVEKQMIETLINHPFKGASIHKTIISHDIYRHKFEISNKNTLIRTDKSGSQGQKHIGAYGSSKKDHGFTSFILKYEIYLNNSFNQTSLTEFKTDLSKNHEKAKSIMISEIGKQLKEIRNRRLKEVKKYEAARLKKIEQQTKVAEEKRMTKKRNDLNYRENMCNSSYKLGYYAQEACKLVRMVAIGKNKPFNFKNCINQTIIKKKKKLKCHQLKK